jgi:hypothetical protein
MGCQSDVIFLGLRLVSGSFWCLMHMDRKPVKESNPAGLFEFPRLPRDERAREETPLTQEELVKDATRIVREPIQVPI